MPSAKRVETRYPKPRHSFDTVAVPTRYVAGDAVGAMHARLEAAFINAEPVVVPWPGYLRAAVLIGTTLAGWALIIATVRSIL